MWKRKSVLIATLSLFFLPVFSAGVIQDEQEGLPKAPFDVKLRSRFDGAVAVVILTWRDMSDDELGFEIYRSDNQGEFKAVGMVGANTTRYEDKIGKYVSGTFRYHVRAFNQAGKSEASNEVGIWF